MEDRSGGETSCEFPVQVFADGGDRFVPTGLVAAPAQQRRDGERGGLEGHGHAVAGEGRDHPGGVTEGAEGLVAALPAEFESRGSEKGTLIEGSPGESFGEDAIASGAEVIEEQFRTLSLASGIEPEKTTDVDAISLDRSESDVAVAAEMHLESASEVETADVRLQSDPAPAPGKASGGPDEAFAGLPLEARAFLDLTTFRFEGEFEPGVEQVPGKSEGGSGEGKLEELFSFGEPSAVEVSPGIFEGSGDVECGEGFGGDPGDEFATDPVAGISCRFVQGHGHRMVAQPVGEAEPGETAAGANNFRSGRSQAARCWSSNSRSRPTIAGQRESLLVTRARLICRRMNSPR